MAQLTNSMVLLEPLEPYFDLLSSTLFRIYFSNHHHLNYDMHFEWHFENVGPLQLICINADLICQINHCVW